jgi:hypothetical protein
MSINSGQLTDNSQPIIKGLSAEPLPDFLENENQSRNPGFHRNEKSNSSGKNGALHDITNLEEKQADQISALLNRMDDLEQELLLYRSLREDNFSLSSSLDLDQATPNQNMNEKANKKLTIRKEFEIKDSKTITLNLCFNIDGMLNIE